MATTDSLAEKGYVLNEKEVRQILSTRPIKTKDIGGYKDIHATTEQRNNRAVSILQNKKWKK